MILLASLPARTSALILAALLGALPAIASAESAAMPRATVGELELDERLPSGDGVQWRKRMADWSRSPDEKSKIVEQLPVADRPGRTARPLLISSGYGWRNDPLGAGHRQHAGIDLPGRLGSAVYATGAGVVSFAGWASGYGNLVQIDHAGGFRTRYGHLSKILVTAGAGVSQGDMVGRMGSTGRSTGSHLHYEVRVRGAPVNPLAFIGNTSVGSVPHDKMEWPQLRDVSPRWTGWDQAHNDSTLPEARIR